MSLTHRVSLEADQATREALAARGLFVPSETSPALFSRVEVVCRFPSGAEQSYSGQVVNLMQGGFYLLLDASVDISAIITELEREPSPPEPSADEPSVDSETHDEESVRSTPGMPKPVWQMIDYNSEISVRQQLADMALADKLRLARGAKRPVRAILVRDSEKRIHLEVVKNPKVQDDEIFEYSGINNLSPAALRWIANQKKYVRRLDLRLNLIFNRNTPQDSALRLMKNLSSANLRRIMNSSKARDALRRAARRKLMQDGVI